MPTKRRLINAKAYEEIELVEDFLVLNGDGDMRVGLELDEKRKERFIVRLKGDGRLVAFGYSYSELIKNLTKYIVESKRG